MDLKKVINNSVLFLFYLIVLSYLLPFRPAFVYYSYQHKSEKEIYKLKIRERNAGTFTLQHNTDIFPQKPKVKFFIDYFPPAASCYSKTIDVNTEEAIPYLSAKY